MSSLKQTQNFLKLREKSKKKYDISVFSLLPREIILQIVTLQKITEKKINYEYWKNLIPSPSIIYDEYEMYFRTTRDRLFGDQFAKKCIGLMKHENLKSMAKSYYFVRDSQWGDDYKVNIVQVQKCRVLNELNRKRKKNCIRGKK